MPVEDVNIPPRVKSVDATDLKPKPSKDESDAEYYEKQTAKLRAVREFQEEKKALDTTINPPPPAEPPFKIQGGINLGTIDLQQQQKDAQDREAKSRSEAETRERELRKKLEDTQQELTETKTTAALKEMATQFGGLIKQLDTKIDGVRQGADPQGLITYFEQIEALGQKMGWTKGTGNGGIDPHFQIELERLKAEEAARGRQFELELKKFDFEVKRVNHKDEEELALKKEELAVLKERDQMIASAPKILGKAIGQAIVEGGGGGAETISADPRRQQAPGAEHVIKQYEATAGEGEWGTIPCPDCRKPVTVGPETTTAVCAACRSQIKIKREKVMGNANSATPESETEEPVSMFGASNGLV